MLVLQSSFRTVLRRRDFIWHLLHCVYLSLSKLKNSSLHVPVEERGQVRLEVEVDEDLVIAGVVVVVPVSSQTGALALHDVHFAET